MKKIKSVKLKNDYRTAYYFLAKGTLLINDGEGYWTTYRGHRYPDNEIRNCKTDLFEIEYEQERKYIDVRVEFENDEYNDSWKPAMIRDIEKTLNNNFIMTKKFKITELAEGTL